MKQKAKSKSNILFDTSIDFKQKKETKQTK